MVGLIRRRNIRETMATGRRSEGEASTKSLYHYSSLSMVSPSFEVILLKWKVMDGGRV